MTNRYGLQHEKRSFDIFMDSAITPVDSEVPKRPSGSILISNVRWLICAMLLAATSINYVDRQTLSILSPVLQPVIGWNDLQYSYIVGAFQLAYGLGLLLAGRLIDRVGTRLGYAIFMGIWSSAAMSHALARTVLGFATARLFLGLGEAGNFPAAIKTTSERFPQSERALATGIFNAGTSLGPVLAPAFVPWVASRFGWQAAFVMTGFFSFTWIIVWLIFCRPRTGHSGRSEPERAYIESDLEDPAGAVSWIHLLSCRQTWSFAVGKFMTDPIWWFLLFWLPLFLAQRFHLSILQLTRPLIVVYFLSAVGSIVGGWLPGALNRRGMPTHRARQNTMLLCACLVMPIFLADLSASKWLCIAVISLAVAAHQGWSANLFTTVSDMFPPAAVGSVVGIGATFGSLAGVLFSLATGHILHLTHNYSPLFAISASAYLLALAVMHGLAPMFKPASMPHDLIAVRRLPTRRS